MVPQSNTRSRLHLWGNINANGTSIITYSDSAAPFQHWWIRTNANGTRRIIPTVSNARVISVRFSSRDPGRGFELWDNFGLACQQWEFVPTSRAIRARIVRDPTVDSLFTDAQLISHFSAMNHAFVTNFGIYYALRTTSPVVRSTVLNGRDCPRRSFDCSPQCCGSNLNCNTRHLKGAQRLNSLERVTNVHTIRVVGHRICWRFPNGVHDRVNGLSAIGGRDSIVSAASGSPPLMHLMQHEISHKLGADDCATGGACVMNAQRTVMDQWCATCASAIRRAN